MEPVSAFAMYKNKSKSNQNPTQKKQKHASLKKIDDDTLESVALDLISNKKMNGISNGTKWKSGAIKKKKSLLKRKNKLAKHRLHESDESAPNIGTSEKLDSLFTSTPIEEMLKNENLWDNRLNVNKKQKLRKHTKFAEQSLDRSIKLEKSGKKISSVRLGDSPQSTLKLRSSSDANVSINHYEQPKKIFEWMIAPVEATEFFESFWEKAPLYIKRNREKYYNEILTTEKLDRILRENALFYTRNVDVVSYENGQRETHNPEGRAIPSALWDYYTNGCSIRILNPHTYCSQLHVILAELQEYFGCMTGVNVYLTPPGTQGFAPHYDDIEAFVLQLEGRKHWRLYAPLTDSEVLPRFSSKNLDRSVLKEPIKELTVEAGDLLYFPRGVIHEGYTDKDAHSLHITISVYQRTAYVDLLEHMLKPALAKASQEDIEFREGLPLQYLKHVGLSSGNASSNIRKEILTKVEKLFGKLFEYVSVDPAADQLGKQFMWDAMPPVPYKHEKACMVHEDGDRMSNGKVYNKAEIHLDLQVRLLRYHSLRLVKEEDEEGQSSVKIYYSTENAKYYHGEEQQFLVIEEGLVSAIKYLQNKYPQYVEVKSLPLKDDIEKMQIVSDLWERGLLVMENPLTL